MIAQPERRPGRTRVTRREEGVVHTWRDHLDAVGGRAEVPELGGLAQRRSQHDVVAPDDLELGSGPQLRLSVALDPGERVEGGDQRQVENVLELVPDHPDSQ